MTGGIYSNYIFNNMSNINLDSCSSTQRNIQNANAANWNLTNYFSGDCFMKRGIDFALSEPAINFSGTHQVGLGGCNIDTNSELTIKKQIRCPGKFSNQERMYMTIPFLGRGLNNPDVESALQQGESITDIKKISKKNEESYVNINNFTPLIPSIQEYIDNTDHIIESDASSGWIRGGIPSRETACSQQNYRNINS
tara:strand:- start:846 stop:1433 length:588 start_codon:yes stop_codon:yes gene_type:complete